MIKKLILLCSFIVLVFVSNSQDQNLYFSGVIGDKISLHENRLSNSTMYGFGVEGSTLYYKSAYVHRWYIGSNADAGTSSILDLDNNALELRSGDFLIQRGGEINFSWDGDKRAGISATNSSPYNELQFFTGAHAESMRIDANGRVGIGTASPGYTFEVEKSNAANNTEYLLGAFNHTGNAGGVYLGYVGNGTNAKEGRVRAGGSIDLAIGTTAFNQAIVVKNTNGYVGIGTTTPESKLAVNGQIRATEVKVLTDVNSVPDYVFEPDYDLRTLKATKKYITKNKHLPEIPSAAEIGENGIDLGDMNMKLLKKIEELTLHLIEQSERVEKLEKEVSTLRDK